MPDEATVGALTVSDNVDPTMPLEYPKTFLDIIIQQNHMREQLSEVMKAINEFRDDRKAEHFTRKDIFMSVGGAVATCAVLFTGLFFLIGTQVTPVQRDIDTLKVETNDRFKQISDTMTERMKAMLDAVQANRAVNIEQDREINDIRLQNAATAARMDRNGQQR